MRLIEQFLFRSAWIAGALLSALLRLIIRVGLWLYGGISVQWEEDEEQRWF